MSEINYKSIELCKIFDFSVTSNGSILTKAFVDNHKGSIPVYGSTMEEKEVSYGFIENNLKGIKYFNDCLTINRNGSAGFLFFREGRFTINSDVTPLVLYKEFKDLIDLKYVKYALQPITIKEFSHIKKAGKLRLSHIEIKIPIDAKGDYDIEKQKELALKYQELEEKKNVLLNKIECLKGTKIRFEDDFSGYRYIDFNDLFRLSRGQIISKADINKNKGNYPVYSTQKEIFGFIKTYMQDGQFLLWNTDGLAGYIRKANGKFSYTNIVGIMIPTDKYNMTTISLDYLKYYLEPIFRENRKGRMGINGKNEYTKLNSTMIKKLNLKIPVPVKEDGSFDLEKQKEIAQKYATIESIKRDLYNQVLELTNIIVI